MKIISQKAVTNMQSIPTSDKVLIRELAKQVAELAAQPIMEEYKRLWRGLNALKPERPMVVADQICWNEMDIDNELTLQTKHPVARYYETELRRAIYRRKHMPDDIPIEPFIRVNKAITGCDLGVEIQKSTLLTDKTNDVISQHYKNQITSMDDVEKVKIPIVNHDKAETARRMEAAHELFDDILEIREEGYDPYLSVWDPISTWMGVESALYAMIDDPEMIHALVNRIVAAYMSMLDQLEQQELLCGAQSLIHCTGAYIDELPPKKTGTKDLWMFGLAQMLGTVSPEMYNEFEIELCMPIFQRFGLVYYGCCEPLDDKIEILRKIKNIRKLSVSPWANQNRIAEEISGQWVFSRKPNPAYLAADSFDENLIRADLSQTINLCKQNNCPLELIQKDISTVRYQPKRLWKWVEIANELVKR